MEPFLYPELPHVRRHGPAGYADYNQYRPWLRDEFHFRCVYCLKREQWGLMRGTFHLDHFKAQVQDQDRVLDYDNLLYACASCNLGKSAAEIPDPTHHFLDKNVTVREDGSIEGSTREAKELIGKLVLMFGFDRMEDGDAYDSDLVDCHYRRKLNNGKEHATYPPGPDHQT